MSFTEKDLARLASFPEQNPNPVIEMDIDTGAITYLNGAAKANFPELGNQHNNHPLFGEIGKKLGTKKDFKCEVTVNGKTFDQKVYFMQDSSLIRIFSNDITHLKEIEKTLLRLASFPEQNPNPVIEVDIDSGAITYLNGAAKFHFPELKGHYNDHLLFSEIEKKLGAKKDFKCEVTVNDKTFEQKIFFMVDQNLVRIYSTDISQLKEVEKNLLRLASFPEQNPTPIMEIDLEGNIIYYNPAFLLHFPDFYTQKLSHPVLQPIVELIPAFRSGKLKSSAAELKIGEMHYEIRARIMEESRLLRMFCIDITVQKETEIKLTELLQTLEVQKQELEEKQKAIIDSIYYAKRIQQSLLPNEKMIGKYLDRSK